MRDCPDCIGLVDDTDEFCRHCGCRLGRGGTGEAVISRRDFLKAAGLGAAGLSLAGIASGMSFRSGSPISFNQGLEVDSDGHLTTRTMTINGAEVVIGHRIITSTLPVTDIESSDKITLQEGDVYQQITES